MTSPHQRHHSFVLRLWWEQADRVGGQLAWRGWVEHVRSGEAAYVQDAAELLAFLERWVDRPLDPAKPPTRLK